MESFADGTRSVKKSKRLWVWPVLALLVGGMIHGGIHLFESVQFSKEVPPPQLTVAQTVLNEAREYQRAKYQKAFNNEHTWIINFIRDCIAINREARFNLSEDDCNSYAVAQMSEQLKTDGFTFTTKPPCEFNVNINEIK